MIRLPSKLLPVLMVALTTVFTVKPAFAKNYDQPATEIRDIFGPSRPPTLVREDLWRSGRPTEQILQDLYAKGVRIIINLEDNEQQAPIEAAWAKKIGFTYYAFPLNSYMQPDDQTIDQILGILKAAQAPLLVHCYHGEDRTGLVIGLERVLIEGWAAQKAYDEMISMGFHQILFGLDQYFHDKVQGH